MKTIFVPTDLSIPANNALRYALQLCKQTGSKIIIFHSVHVPVIPALIPEWEFNKIVGVQETAMLAKMKKETTRICGKLELTGMEKKIKYLSKSGLSTVKDILWAAKTHKADLIVMGTHGATGLGKLLFGSNTVELISQSRIPVLAIPKAYRFKAIEKIIYASDLKNMAREVKALFPIAKAMNAGVEVMFLDYGWPDGKDIEQKFTEMMKKLRLLNFDIQRKKVSIEKSIPEYLNKYAVKNKNAILAMFPEDKSFWDNVFMGSKTGELAYHLKLPLLSIRKSALK